MEFKTRKNEKLRIPKLIHMTSLNGTILAAIDEVNREGFYCAEGVVKMSGSKVWQTTWAIMPLVDFQPTHDPSMRKVENLTYNNFPDRRLRLQLFNAPFSLLLSSTPVLHTDLRQWKFMKDNMTLETFRKKYKIIDRKVNLV